ncbi:hypothetical protein ETH_00001110 [Eimeria tenella]|uniref:Uncharacterized protein n=1 Tax=Eimeria tenella TaxID=5802 RepID=U6KJ23_EIMTE|nr:hypothetical protein ETH_00001110 [Eimeria tenella]CDJ37909.1 hypothetical protein ETH_00001110 [Eimeria tenella]|eukprot:XP_013228747.1 hypothetical protein ETH_00001110 [Eimeria tenella]
MFSRAVDVLFLERKKSLVKERSWSACQYVKADELEWLVLHCNTFALSGGFVEVVRWRRLAERRLDWSLRGKG